MGKSTKQMVQEILEQPREQVVESLMRGFGQILTADQYKKAEQVFLTMPDDAFKQMVEDSIRNAPTPARHIKLVMNLREYFNKSFPIRCTIQSTRWLAAFPCQMPVERQETA